MGKREEVISKLRGVPDGMPSVEEVRAKLATDPNLKCVVCYARISFDRYWWWVTNGSGSTAQAGNTQGKGATNGYSFGGGPLKHRRTHHPPRAYAQVPAVLPSSRCRCNTSLSRPPFHRCH